MGHTPSHEDTERGRPLPTVAEARVGDELAGKYRLEQLLGSGGMGDVYRATNKLVGRTVAIKILRAEHAASNEVVDRFMREARAANLVRHRNVVDVIDIGNDRGLPFIVQELLEGEDLSKYIEHRGGKLPLEEALELLQPVIDAVAAAHASGVVHRDIKPENVFLQKKDGTLLPKLLDFGISKVRSLDVRTTEVGVTLGTPLYMSPEMIQGARDADPRSDVWALGIMLFEVLSGRIPFDAPDAPALFVAVATRDAPRLVDVNPMIPPSISRVVERCLRRNRDERYPSAAELARDLAHVLEGTELEPTGKVSLVPGLLAGIPDLEVPKAPRVPSAPVPAKKEAPAKRAAPEPAEVPDLPPPPSLRLPEPTSSARRVAAAPPEPPPAPRAPPPAPSSSQRVARSEPRPPMGPPPAVSASAAHVRTAPVVPAGPASYADAARSARHGRAPMPMHRQPEADLGGPDMSWIVPLAVMTVVVVIGLGVLMAIAHRSEGWPIIAFLAKPAAPVAAALQLGLGGVAGAIGVTYARRGYKHWRGELSGGIPSALFGAVIAIAALFAAIELISAAW